MRLAALRPGLKRTPGSHRTSEPHKADKARQDPTAAVQPGDSAPGSDSPTDDGTALAAVVRARASSSQSQALLRAAEMAQSEEFRQLLRDYGEVARVKAAWWREAAFARLWRDIGGGGRR